MDPGGDRETRVGTTLEVGNYLAIYHPATLVLWSRVCDVVRMVVRECSGEGVLGSPELGPSFEAPCRPPPRLQKPRPPPPAGWRHGPG